MGEGEMGEGFLSDGSCLLTCEFGEAPVYVDVGVGGIAHAGFDQCWAWGGWGGQLLGLRRDREVFSSTSWLWIAVE